MGIFSFGVKRGLRKNAKKIAFIVKKLMEQLQAKTGKKFEINKIDFSYEFPGNAIYQFICPETGKLSEDFWGMDVKEAITIRTPNVTRLFTAYSLSHSEKSAEKFCALFEKIILDELGDNWLTAKTIGAHCSGTGINDAHFMDYTVTSGGETTYGTMSMTSSAGGSSKIIVICRKQNNE